MLEDILKQRRKKLNRYAAVADPYPAVVKRTVSLQEVIKNFYQWQKSGKRIFITGRIFSWRDQGQIIFADLHDESGRLQLVLNKRQTRNFELLKETVETGDFVESGGKLFKTKTGERSLAVDKLRIIAKSLRPLPLTWYNLEDKETLLRKRYLDMLIHPEIREIFVKKELFWNEIRNFLKKAGFVEVALPILEPLPGGADAEPFITHHNALNQDFYLRISLELPLKKMLVGGFERVFEIGRIFRNEGIDREHLQDYTQMECYWAYHDYEAMMKLTKSLYQTVIKKIFGSLKTKYAGQTIDWSKPWPKVDYYKIFKKESGLDLRTASQHNLYQKAKSLGLPVDQKLGRGRLIDLIYKKKIRPKLIQPCFLVDPPVDIEPLAKRLVNDPQRVARFQIMAGGTELGKGFSELNDPLDQRARFEEQMKLREAGDKEAQRLDEDFLEALEYGMPPAAGFGMSERLFAVLVDRPIREIIVFPLMRQERE